MRWIWAWCALSGLAWLACTAQFRDIAQVEHARQGSRLSDVADAHDRAPILTGSGFALSSVGVVGVVAGLVWALKAPRDQERAASARRLRLVSGRF